MTTAIEEEQSTTDEEIETEKDHTSLVPPITDYHEKLITCILAYEDDAVEIAKIQARLKADALNLTNMAARLETQIANQAAVKAKRDDIKKFSADCLGFLKPKEPEVKV